MCVCAFVCVPVHVFVCVCVHAQTLQTASVHEQHKCTHRRHTHVSIREHVKTEEKTGVLPTHSLPPSFFLALSLVDNCCFVLTLCCYLFAQELRQLPSGREMFSAQSFPAHAQRRMRQTSILTPVHQTNQNKIHSFY